MPGQEPVETEILRHAERIRGLAGPRAPSLAGDVASHPLYGAQLAVTPQSLHRERTDAAPGSASTLAQRRPS